MTNDQLEWQPIDTAPKDALILGHAGGMMRLVLWEGAWKQVGATIERGWFEPTHWLPLPEAPLRCAWIASPRAIAGED